MASGQDCNSREDRRADQTAADTENREAKVAMPGLDGIGTGRVRPSAILRSYATSRAASSRASIVRQFVRSNPLGGAEPPRTATVPSDQRRLGSSCLPDTSAVRHRHTERHFS